MELKKVNIDELISPEYNPRIISDEEMEKLERSLNEFGYCDPLIVNDVNMHIVGGNQRYHAMKKLGFTEVDVVFIHQTNMSKEKGLNIALNKISGEWDYPKLEVLFEELSLDTNFDVSLTGFDYLELQEFGETLDDLDDLDIGMGDFNNGLNETVTLIVSELTPSDAEELYEYLINKGHNCKLK